jgi:hypothetical protein
MKLTTSITRDVWTPEGVHQAQQVDTLELDDQVDPPEVFAHHMALTAFASESQPVA